MSRGVAKPEHRENLCHPVDGNIAAGTPSSDGRRLHSGSEDTVVRSRNVTFQGLQWVRGTSPASR